MKKLYLIWINILMSVCIYAQQTPASIEVKGTVYFVPTTFTYSTQIVMSQDYLSDYYNQIRSLDEIKQEYFQKIAVEGIDPKGFKEDKLSYLSLGYKKEGTFLVFDTNSKEIIQKLFSNTIAGVRVNSIYVETNLTTEKVQELATAAIEKARKKAQKIVEKQNRKIGKILKIIDHQNDKVSQFSILSTNGESSRYPYSTTVVFELL